MTRSKFVSAHKPTDYADQLHGIQRKIEKLAKEMKELESTEKHLQAYLMRFSKGESFVYNGADGFEKRVRINHVSRLILDQERCKKLLKGRTPYCTSTWSTVAVDWIYE